MTAPAAVYTASGIIAQTVDQVVAELALDHGAVLAVGDAVHLVVRVEEKGCVSVYTGISHDPHDRVEEIFAVGNRLG